MKLREYIGRRVLARRKLTNGFGGMPAGTIYTVTGTWRSGFSLRSDPCAHCGHFFGISRVPRAWVTLVEEHAA